MREIIATGKTVNLAIESACAELGASRDEVEVEVLEVEVKRLFKTIPAKVRVTVEDEMTPAPAKAPAPVREQAPAPQAPENKPPRQPEKKREEATRAPREEKPAVAPVAEEPALPDLPAEGEKAAAALEFVRAVSDAMQVEYDNIHAVKRGESTLICVEGEKVGALIGRRGETMEALSYLTSLVANRAGGDYEKVSLDVAGYRSKREQDLAGMARRIGTKVQKTGRSQALEPMSAYDRRIVHSVIGGMENLSSESSGEGAARRVVIRSTAPGATEGNDRGPRPAPGADRGDRGPRKQPMDRPERKTPTGDTPVAVSRSTTVDESFDLPLYGKIEF